MIKIIKHPLAKKAAFAIVVGVTLKIIVYQMEKRTKGVVDDE